MNSQFTVNELLLTLYESCGSMLLYYDCCNYFVFFMYNVSIRTHIVKMLLNLSGRAFVFKHALVNSGNVCSVQLYLVYKYRFY